MELQEKRLSLHRRNSPKVKRKPVIRLFDYKYFNSMDETKYYGYSPTHVRECCNGIRKTHKGSNWRYATRDEVLKYGRKYSFVKNMERGVLVCLEVRSFIEKMKKK